MSSRTIAFRYDSANRQLSAWRELLELVRYRDLLYLLIVNSIKTRYKRSALGILWTLLNPLLNMVVLTIAFSAIFKSSLTHYPVYVLTGLIGWNFFTQSSLTAMNTLVWGGSLLRRVYIPRTIFAASAIGSGLINLLLALLPLVGIMLLTGHPISPSWWFLPIAIFILTMFTLGVGLLISTLAVFFVDVADIYQVLIQAWFYLTPIMYPREIVPARFAWLMTLNPLFYLIELFRAPLYDGALPDPGMLLIATGWSLLMLAVGWSIFTWKADEFAYRI